MVVEVGRRVVVVLVGSVVVVVAALVVVRGSVVVEEGTGCVSVVVTRAGELEAVSAPDADAIEVVVPGSDVAVGVPGPVAVPALVDPVTPRADKKSAAVASGSVTGSR